MNILLITAGGAIDRAVTTALKPVKPFKRVKSQAFHTLMMLGEKDGGIKYLDHLKIGRHAAKAIDNATYLQLIGALTQEMRNADRVIVAMSSRQIQEIGLRLSQQFPCGVSCPIVLTGAEAPYQSPAESASHNLRTALSQSPFTKPGIYFAEGAIFETLTPHLTEYTRVHPIRATGTAWKPRQRSVTA